MLIKETAARAPHYAKAIRIKADDVAEDGTFVGYGSVFNVEDGGGDIVMPGAFAGSLAEHKRRGTTVKLLWQHLTAEPIGIWVDIHEDSHGLLCKGQILTSFDRGRQALDLMRRGGVDGLSIGYECKLWEMDAIEDGAHGGSEFGPMGYPSQGVRRLKEIDLWEVSVVTFPMNQDARIDTVKRRRDSLYLFGNGAPELFIPRGGADIGDELAELATAIKTRGAKLSR
jgi:HK97 family phage prohead protease